MEKRIVVVDEEVMMVKAIKRLLRHEPFDVHGFDSPRLALAHIDRIYPRVVLADLHMPEMDGVLFLEHVRLRWPDTVRMIMAETCIPESAVDALQRGDVSTILHKPLDAGRLIRTIHEAFTHCDTA